MVAADVPDWKVTGTQTAAGGKFQRVRILGDAEVTGDLECDALRVMGTLLVRGSLQVSDLRVMGTLTVDGAVRGDRLRVTGEYVCHGDCAVEELMVRGVLSVDGLLNAGKLDLILHGPSRVREMGGDEIHVRPHNRLLPGGKHLLTVGSVEGDDVRLRQTIADTVRGRRVEVGEGCEIENVEYVTNFRTHGTARVEHSEQVPGGGHDAGER